ncbi:hypothetical protein GCM10027446_08070 [Angustibacter peucedani]
MPHAHDRPAPVDIAIGRRPVLGAGLAVAATAFVSACGSGDDSAAGGSSSGSSSSSSSSSGSGGSDGGAALAKVSDVPVGGAISAKAPDGTAILITQPTEGTVLAFKARCTHMGCTVAPGQGELDCPCHQSAFDLNGKNISGPAPSPLATFAVTVKDGDVVAS